MSFKGTHVIFYNIYSQTEIQVQVILFSAV